MKKLLALALTVAMVASLAACGSSSADTTESTDTAEATSEVFGGVAIEGDTIKIGVFEPTTGENGGGGLQEVLGVRYANVVAPTVDINGTTYNIELVEVDNQSDKTAATTAAQSLISSGVVAVVGSYGSAVSIAAGQTFLDAQVPAMGASCTSVQVTLDNDYYFRTCFLDDFQGVVLASYAIEQGYTSAAVISQNGDDYSTGLTEYFKQSFEAQGGEIVAAETYQTNESDFSAILTTIKNSGAEVVFIPSSIATATLILPQIEAAGIDAQILASDTWENESILEAVGDAAEGYVVSTFFDENDDANPSAAEFVTGFKEYLNSDSAILTSNGGTDGIAAVSALGYDAYMCIYAGLEALDGTDELSSGALREAIAGVTVEGVTGTISFDENGDAIKSIAYIKQVEDGAFNFVRTQEAE